LLLGFPPPPPIRIIAFALEGSGRRVPPSFRWTAAVFPSTGRGQLRSVFPIFSPTCPCGTRLMPSVLRRLNRETPVVFLHWQFRRPLSLSPSNFKRPIGVILCTLHVYERVNVRFFSYHLPSSSVPGDFSAERLCTLFPFPLIPPFGSLRRRHCPPPLSPFG